MTGTQAYYIVLWLIAVVFCVREILTRPPLYKVDKDEMRQFIKEMTTTTTYEPTKRPTETCCDMYRWVVEAKENRN